MIYLIATQLTIYGSVSAAGGLGGTDDYHYNGGNRLCCDNGGPGSVGRLRFDYGTYTTGASTSVNPAPGHVLQDGALCPNLPSPPIG